MIKKLILLGLLLLPSISFGANTYGVLTPQSSTSILVVPHSVSLPSSCSEGQRYQDTGVSDTTQNYSCVGGTWIKDVPQDLRTTASPTFDIVHANSIDTTGAPNGERELSFTQNTVAMADACSAGEWRFYVKADGLLYQCVNGAESEIGSGGTFDEAGDYILTGTWDWSGVNGASTWPTFNQNTTGKADTAGNADTVTNGVYTGDAGTVFQTPLVAGTDYATPSSLPDQDVDSGSSPTFDGTNFTGIPLSGVDGLSYVAPIYTATEFTSAIAADTPVILLAEGTFTAPSGVACGFAFSGHPNITVKGAGMGKTILKWPNHEKGASTKNTLAGGEFVVCPTNGTTLEDLTIDGNHWEDWYAARTSPETETENQTITSSAATQEGAGGVLAYDKDNITLRNVEIVNTSFTPSAFWYGDNLRIENSHIHDSYHWDAHYAYSSGGTDLFRTAGDYASTWEWGHTIGIYLGLGMTNSNLINNIVEYNGVDGVNGSTVTGLKISGGSYNYNGLGMDNNSVGVCGACGVFLSHGSTYVTISGVDGFYNTETGFQFDGADTGGRNKYFSVTNSTAKYNEDGGFNINASDHLTFTNNIAVNNDADNATCQNAYRGSGFIFSGSTDATIEGNVSVDDQGSPTQNYGFYFSGATNSQQSGNVAIGNATANIYNDGSYKIGGFGVWDGSLLGIGTSTPDWAMVVHKDGANSYIASSVARNSQSVGSGFVARSSNGTEASKTATASGDVLFNLFGQGYNAAGSTFVNGFILRASATENFDSTHRGTKAELLLSQPSGTAPTLIFSAQTPLVGTYTGGSAYVCVHDAGDIYASDSVCP